MGDIICLLDVIEHKFGKPFFTNTGFVMSADIDYQYANMDFTQTGDGYASFDQAPSLAEIHEWVDEYKMFLRKKELKTLCNDKKNLLRERDIDYMAAGETEPSPYQCDDASINEIVRRSILTSSPCSFTDADNVDHQLDINDFLSLLNKINERYNLTHHICRNFKNSIENATTFEELSTLNTAILDDANWQNL